MKISEGGPDLIDSLAMCLTEKTILTTKPDHNYKVFLDFTLLHCSAVLI